MIFLLNTSILTDFGIFSYAEVSLDIAKQYVEREGFHSAIGHQSTTDVISELLEINCPVNRVNFKQGFGDKALVFKLKGRPEEGKVLTRDEIEAIGYSWGLLIKLETAVEEGGDY